MKKEVEKQSEEDLFKKARRKLRNKLKAVIRKVSKVDKSMAKRYRFSLPTVDKTNLSPSKPVKKELTEKEVKANKKVVRKQKKLELYTCRDLKALKRKVKRNLRRKAR